MSAHPRLHVIAGGKATQADVLDRERGDRVRERSGLVEINSLGQGQRQPRAESVSGPRRIDDARGLKSFHDDLPPAA